MKKYIFIIIALIVLGIIGLCILKVDKQILISLIGILLAFVALFYQVHSFKQQIKLQNFSDYTKRYQEIVLNFPESINEQSFQLSDIKPKLRKDKTMRYMRSYFDLCYEEFLLYEKNLIDEDFWNIWMEGMKFAFSKPAFEQAWAIIQKDTKFDEHFEKFVRTSMSKAD